VAEQESLSVVSLPGISSNSLGNYLAALGLLRILSRRWPRVRAAWKDALFSIVGGPATLDEILDLLCEVAKEHGWTPYDRGWADDQKNSPKTESGKKSGKLLALWQASAEERDLELFAAHAVPAATINFNPLLGSGGNAGRRSFADGWKRSADALASDEPTTKSVPAAEKRAQLKCLFLGEPLTWMMEKLNGASWFSDANKLYNSGQAPYREEPLSPWAMALACEGLAFFAGGASRRLGARAPAIGAFPFVTRAAAPLTSGEAGRDQAEVWAPFWERPMTVGEVAALFSRGRAELNGRGVMTPSAFAVAITRRGVDAGITGFRRFVLARTTSVNTFEPRFEGTLPVYQSGPNAASQLQNSTRTSSIAFGRLLTLVDQLPRDSKVGKRWRFVGLRGPLEAAMIRATADPFDTEAVRALIDAAVSALDRVDRNRSFRERRIAWEPLPVRWVSALFGDQTPGVEARLALALVSSFPQERPFTLYRFGTEFERGRRFVHPKTAPARWVWRMGPFARVLTEVLRRRTLDWEEDRDAQEPLRLQMPAASAQVDAWLAQRVDDELLARWLSRLALFDWRFVPQGVRSLATPDSGVRGTSGALCLFGLLQPLFDLRKVLLPRRNPDWNPVPRESGARTPAVARTIASLLRGRDVGATVRLAASRYAMAGAPLILTDASWQVADPERLLASLLFPVSDHERAALVGRWLRPRRQKGERSYA